jgi:Na+/proline symporter
MKCPSCGAELNNNDTFCTSCGKRVDGATQTATGTTTDNNQIIQENKTNKKTNNKKAITGFIISIVSLIVAGYILGSIGAILSAQSYNEIKENNESGKGFAIAGIIIGILSIALIVLEYALGIIQ